MNILSFLNSDIILPILVLFVALLYTVDRIRTRRKFKR